MKKHSLLAVLSTFAVLLDSSIGQEATKEPVELQNVRDQYREQVQAGMDPVKRQYVAALETMKRTRGGAGDLTGALAVQKEIESVANRTSAGPDAEDDPKELRTARGWYRQQVKIISDPLKPPYLTTLETLKRTLGAKGDLAGALLVQKEIDSFEVTRAASSSAQKGAQLIIWNQDNGGKGDRGTRKVNVVLFAGGREVWRRNSVQLRWQLGQQMKEEILLPNIAVEKIRVEVTELVNDRGGLAEIEYLRAGKNLALNRPVAVSGVWENNSKHAGRTLTDGLPGNYWLLPDKQKGWAEISLQESR